LADEPHRWVMPGAGAPLESVDPSAKPGPDQVLIEIDACSVWRANVGYAFGDVHRDAGDNPEMLRRITGHVLETGENAMFFADRPVVLTGAVPCGQHHACWTGSVAACPNKATGPGGEPAGPCVVAPAREVMVAEKHQPHPLGPGLDAFKDG
jgi:threonine dehydrogenase-like Zn-dependent dehydrogenase